MNTQFQTLFSVNIAHGYYSNACQDFGFVVPEETAQLLKNRKLLARTREGVFYLLYESDETETPLISAEGVTLRFGLLLLNPFFSNITQGTFDPLSSVLFYRNLTDVNALNPAEDMAIDDLSAPLQKEGLWGVIDVTVDSSFYTAAPDFEIAFDAKGEILKYYIVATNYTETEFNQLSVADAGFTEDARPEVTFTKVSAGGFLSDDISPELLGDSTAQIVLFKSQTAIARQEKARKKIQLSKNGSVLMTHLPQPGTDRPHSDLIIQVSKP